MENSAWLRVRWCLPLYQTTLSTGKALCSTVWQPQLDPCEKRGVPPEEGRGLRILHCISPTEIRPLNNGRERFWQWKDFQHIVCLHDQPFQSCPSLWNPMDHSPPSSSVHGTFSGKNTGVGCRFLLRGSLPDIGINPSSSVKVKVKSLSRVRLFAAPWTAAYQTPLSMGFSRQEYWSGLPFLISHTSGRFFIAEPPGKPLSTHYLHVRTIYMQSWEIDKIPHH